MVCSHNATASYFVANVRGEVFAHFLNAFWKSRSVSVFSITCDSASIASVMSKWQPSFMFNQGNRKVGWVGDNSYVFDQKFPGEKGSVRHCVGLLPKFRTKSSNIFKHLP
jgi:hypothetical protein